MRPGDTVQARATVVDINRDSRRITLETVATVGDTVVIDSESTIVAQGRRADGAVTRTIDIDEHRTYRARSNRLDRQPSGG